eukprot:7381599-Prymnesium_polylepis.2
MALQRQKEKERAQVEKMEAERDLEHYVAELDNYRKNNQARTHASSCGAWTRRPLCGRQRPHPRPHRTRPHLPHTPLHAPPTRHALVPLPYLNQLRAASLRTGGGEFAAGGRAARRAGAERRGAGARRRPDRRAQRAASQAGGCAHGGGGGARRRRGAYGSGGGEVGGGGAADERAGQGAARASLCALALRRSLVPRQRKAWRATSPELQSSPLAVDVTSRNASLAPLILFNPTTSMIPHAWVPR